MPSTSRMNSPFGNNMLGQQQGQQQQPFQGGFRSQFNKLSQANPDPYGSTGFGSWNDQDYGALTQAGVNAYSHKLADDASAAQGAKNQAFFDQNDAYMKPANTGGGGTNIFGFPTSGSGSGTFGFPTTGGSDGGAVGSFGGGSVGNTGGLFGDDTQIDTGINPVAPYSGQMTQEAVNAARQGIDQQAYMPHLLNQGQREGVRSDVSLSNIGNALNMNNMGQQAKAQAGAQIPLQHGLANAQSALAGELSRSDMFTKLMQQMNQRANATATANTAGARNDMEMLGGFLNGEIN